MIQKKVCMLGAFAVGKTSLVKRFVDSMFSEKYQTTVGVKIDRKRIQLDEQEVNLVLWDIHGEDELQKVRLSYVRGTSGSICSSLMEPGMPRWKQPCVCTKM